jgi:hypothetical protein
MAPTKKTLGLDQACRAQKAGLKDLYTSWVRKTRPLPIQTNLKINFCENGNPYTTFPAPQHPASLSRGICWHCSTHPHWRWRSSPSPPHRIPLCKFPLCKPRLGICSSSILLHRRHRKPLHHIGFSNHPPLKTPMATTSLQNRCSILWCLCWRCSGVCAICFSNRSLGS